MNDRAFISVDEAAALLGYSPRSVTRWCRRGRFPGAYQVSGRAGSWRIPRASLEPYLVRFVRNDAQAKTTP